MFSTSEEELRQAEEYTTRADLFRELSEPLSARMFDLIAQATRAKAAALKVLEDFPDSSGK